MKPKLLRFKVRGRWVERWYDGRFCKPPLPPILVEEKGIWRLSVGMNFVVTRKYYGALIQEWFSYSPSDMLDVLKRELIQMVEAYVGYPNSEWWFIHRVGWGIQRDFAWHSKYRVVEEGRNAEVEAEA